MRIDTAKIENYESLSAEEKLKALEAFEFDTPAPKESEEVMRLKNALSKANAEAGEWKKALREKQTEQERAEAERAERERAVEDELRALRRDKTVSGYVAQYLALGYAQELALKAANAKADNDAATEFACQREYKEALKAEIEASALNKQPTLTPGAPPTSQQADKEAYNKLRSVMGLPPIK